MRMQGLRPFVLVIRVRSSEARERFWLISAHLLAHPQVRGPGRTDGSSDSAGGGRTKPSASSKRRRRSLLPGSAADIALALRRRSRARPDDRRAELKELPRPLAPVAVARYHADGLTVTADNARPMAEEIDLGAALNAVSDVIQNRPRPLREFNQIYMKAATW